jgi:hypothetical protein
LNGSFDDPGDLHKISLLLATAAAAHQEKLHFVRRTRKPPITSRCEKLPCENDSSVSSCEKNLLPSLEKRHDQGTSSVDQKLSAMKS